MRAPRRRPLCLLGLFFLERPAWGSAAWGIIEPEPEVEPESGEVKVEALSETSKATHSITGLCAVDPCVASTTCCCWSSAGVPENDFAPNPSQAEADRKCGPEPAAVATAGLILRKECFQEPCDESGVYAEMIASGQAMYEDRDLCCVMDPDDVVTESKIKAGEVVPTTEPVPEWHAEPTAPPPSPDSTWRLFMKDDEAAANMEASGAAYADAAENVAITSRDLAATGAALKKTWVATKGSRENAARLRGALHNFATQENAALKKFAETMRATAPSPKR